MHFTIACEVLIRGLFQGVAAGAEAHGSSAAHAIVKCSDLVFQGARGGGDFRHACRSLVYGGQRKPRASALGY